MSRQETRFLNARHDQKLSYQMQCDRQTHFPSAYFSTQLIKHVPHARSSLITYYNTFTGRQCGGGGGLHLRRVVAVCGYGDMLIKNVSRYHLSSQQLYSCTRTQRCAFRDTELNFQSWLTPHHFIVGISQQNLPGIHLRIRHDCYTMTF